STHLRSCFRSIWLENAPMKRRRVAPFCLSSRPTAGRRFVVRLLRLTVETFRYVHKAPHEPLHITHGLLKLLLGGQARSSASALSFKSGNLVLKLLHTVLQAG